MNRNSPATESRHPRKKPINELCTDTIISADIPNTISPPPTPPNDIRTAQAAARHFVQYVLPQRHILSVVVSADIACWIDRLLSLPSGTVNRETSDVGIGTSSQSSSSSSFIVTSDTSSDNALKESQNKTREMADMATSSPSPSSSSFPLPSKCALSLGVKFKVLAWLLATVHRWRRHSSLATSPIFSVALQHHSDVLERQIFDVADVAAGHNNNNTDYIDGNTSNINERECDKDTTIKGGNYKVPSSVATAAVSTNITLELLTVLVSMKKALCRCQLTSLATSANASTGKRVLPDIITLLGPHSHDTDLMIPMRLLMEIHSEVIGGIMAMGNGSHGLQSSGEGIPHSALSPSALPFPRWLAMVSGTSDTLSLNGNNNKNSININIIPEHILLQLPQHVPALAPTVMTAQEGEKRRNNRGNDQKSAVIPLLYAQYNNTREMDAHLLKRTFHTISSGAGDNNGRYGLKGVTSPVTSTTASTPPPPPSDVEAVDVGILQKYILAHHGGIRAGPLMVTESLFIGKDGIGADVGDIMPELGLGNVDGSDGCKDSWTCGPLYCGVRPCRHPPIVAAMKRLVTVLGLGILAGMGQPPVHSPEIKGVIKHQEDMKEVLNRRLRTINRLTDHRAYQSMVNNNNNSQNKTCEMGDMDTSSPSSSYKSHPPSNPQRETFAVFMKDISIGLDMRLMSLAGGAVGYYLCFVRGLDSSQCVIGAAVGVVLMMGVDSALLIGRIGRDDIQRGKRNINIK